MYSSFRGSGHFAFGRANHIGAALDFQAVRAVGALGVIGFLATKYKCATGKKADRKKFFGICHVSQTKLLDTAVFVSNNNENQTMHPSVIKVEPKDDYKVYIEFDNNERGILSMKPYLVFGVFKRISDKNIFSKVRVSFDTIAWPGGIDLDPQFVYKNCNKQAAQ